MNESSNNSHDNSRNFREKYTYWRYSRKARKRRRTAAKITDAAAFSIGYVLRLGLKAVVTVLLILVTTGVLFTCIFAVYVKTCLMEDLDITLEEASLALSSTIWYQDNGEWVELVTLSGGENRIWVDYEDIPEYMEHAAVAIEDKRFYTHKGVDWYRTVSAFGNMFVSMDSTFGGSTITQQLIKNVTEYDDVTVQRKLLEIFRALEFEKLYTKEEIITWYLNEIYLGEGCYGVGTAAQTYFGKDVSDLSLAECACIISITNNPSQFDPLLSETTRQSNKTRQETVLREMYEQDYITYEEYIDAVNEELVFRKSADDSEEDEIYSWYVDAIIYDVTEDLMEQKGVSYSVAQQLLLNGGYNIYACVDMDIQNIVDNYYANPANLPTAYRSSGQQLQSAIVIMDPYSGAVVALAGGVGEKTGNLVGNRATQSLYARPPGSSLKPLSVYAPAFDLGLVTQDTTINDSPGLSLSGTSWYPSNSGNTYSGVITIRNALVNSKNTVAAQLLDTIGLQTSWDYLTNHFGLTTLVEDYITDTGETVSDYGYAPLALGQLSYGVTPLEMAQAYTAFVNDGIMSYGRTYSLITDSNGDVVISNPTTQVAAIQEDTAWNMADMLQEAVRSGTGTDAFFDSTAVAGKTGTTSDDKDRYFVGFTMYYVCAVWTGYDTPSQMYFSSNPAAVIFRDIMSQIHTGLPYLDFPTPTEGSGSVTFVDETEDYTYSTISEAAEEEEEDEEEDEDEDEDEDEEEGEWDEVMFPAEEDQPDSFVPAIEPTATPYVEPEPTATPYVEPAATPVPATEPPAPAENAEL